MTSFNPIRVSANIERSYMDYLLSAFEFADESVQQEFRSAIDNDFLSAGPYLQLTPPYKRSSSVRELVDAGVLHPGLLVLDEVTENARVLPADRPLYEHQVTTIRKVADSRNLLVATGTGSGKTEAFLLPILDHLLKERDSGSLRKPGVRALLLYPMNALANDQVKRLREILARFPEITFGRYIGDTDDSQRDAEADYLSRFGHSPLPNELVSREEIQKSPPHILITNFAMLEYLLLRPEDTSLFDGPTGGFWKFIVLDEVHTYQGAKGGEIAMLLRRLRDRVHASRKAKIRYIGTSATIGDLVEGRQRVERFGQGLFDETFELEDESSCFDVVLPTREPTPAVATSWLSSQSQIEGLGRTVREANRDQVDVRPLWTELRAIATAIDVPLIESLTVWENLGRLVIRDGNFVRLRELLSASAQDLRRASEVLFGNSQQIELVKDYVDICSAARVPGEEYNALSARYHFMLRALEGVFRCFSPEHSSEQTRLFLERHEECPHCATRGVLSRTFELGPCSVCGVEYIIGSLEPVTDEIHRIVPAERFGEELLYLSLQRRNARDSDEDEDVEVGDDDSDIDLRTLCLQCGALSETELRCGHPARASHKVRVSKPKEVGLPLRKCAECASRTTGRMVSRVETGQDAPGAVIASSLYRQLPPSSDPTRGQRPGEGRKLLTFSDSRQDAAFFAPYFERLYTGTVQRNLIYRAVLAAEQPVIFDELVEPVKKLAEQHRIIDASANRDTKRRQVNEWIFREFIATDMRQNLSGVGLLRIQPAVPEGMTPPVTLTNLGMTASQSMSLVKVLLNTLRERAASTVPENVDIQAEVFYPNNRVTGVREFSEQGILGWAPHEKRSNRRLYIVEQTLRACDLDADPREILRSLWTDEFQNRDSAWSQFLTDARDYRGRALKRLDHRLFEFGLLDNEGGTPVCALCRQVTNIDIGGFCIRHACGGTVVQVPDSRVRKASYRDTYMNNDPHALEVHEHTGQLEGKYATRLQEAFVDGKVNVLSCSTTFELGVDLGEIQAVMMRNVPPSPANYVQRAGRAGRRLDSAALALTFAQRRSHDLYYFASPQSMVNGAVRAPQISVDNPRIIRRHIHAVAISAFARTVVASGRTWPKVVGDFFISDFGPSLADELKTWLQKHPEELGEAINRLIPDDALATELRLGDWGWVAALYEDDVTEDSGWMERATREVVNEVTDLLNQLETLRREQESFTPGSKDWMRRSKMMIRLGEQLGTIRGKQLLDFLATRVVIPKYGFPVDVVEMEVWRAGKEESEYVELTRDLRLGIVDFAPTAQTVAAKRLWRSVGLKKPPNKAFERIHWRVCGECQTFRRTSGPEDESPCSVCGSSQVDKLLYRPAIKPSFGFIGELSPDKPGESRPVRVGGAVSYFSEFAGIAPEFEEVVMGPGLVKSRVSRQGRITVLNKGPRGRGFEICDECGFAQLAPTRVSKRKREQEEHTRPGTNRTCRYPVSSRFLAHEFLTDTIELVFPNVTSMEAAWSCLAALVNSAEILGIDSREISGTVRAHGDGGKRKALVIFDSVPGGAGYSKLIRESLEELTLQASQMVRNCRCGIETACYACLKSHENQYAHEHLKRNTAIDVFDSVGF
jgi:hypothetical protein